MRRERFEDDLSRRSAVQLPAVGRAEVRCPCAAAAAAAVVAERRIGLVVMVVRDDLLSSWLLWRR